MEFFERPARLPNSDCFVFTFHRDVVNSTVTTKRSVLSLIARMFDPLGWLAPIIVTAKMFLQQLWKSDLGWDDELPPQLALRWEDFTRRLFSSQRIPVPRWIGTHQSSLVEMHGFSDASQWAMAAAVYLRVQDDSSGVRASLLITKTKVTPLKAMTIPRLELAAAVLLAKLVTSVERVNLDLADAPLHLWVDSSVALAWIRAHSSRWKDFVSNRVSLIQDLVPRACWHHISGTENPSDAASRGLSPDQLKEHPLWWTGPDWLRLPSTAWPNYIPSPLEDVDLEEKPSVVLTASFSPQVWDLVDRFSSLNLLRVTARIMQATKLMRREVRREDSSAILTLEQLNAALQFWIRSTQAVFFEQELKLLKNGSSLPRSSSLYKLTPALDSEGLLRVGGRLRHSGLEYDCKHPIILPRQSRLGTLLVDDSHRRTLHGGVQLTLAHLRERFWILSGRATVRSFILKCVPCARQRGSLLGQQMGQLPSTRVTPSRPFFNSGVDYAGPYTLKTWKGRSAKTYKAYFIIFVCFSTSAIHLELATDYSTEGFITTYKRFTSRRGICSTLTSDCGSNLVGADAELKRLFSSSSAKFAHLRSLLANNHTEWRFNPPAAPHFGGKWEAGVKSVKFHLRRVVGEALLTYEEFSSVLTQVEGILNSRPLCLLTDDPDDFSALTPGHFLTGAAISTLPEPSTDHIPVSRLSRWQLHRQMVSHFWRRWSHDCLQRMQIGSKWLQPHHNVRVGSLVLVADQRYPPSKWPLARITAVHPGADGHVRVVTVRTAVGSEFRRPVVKVCLLPINPDESDQAATP